MTKLTVLVTGATGQQGGAVARALLAKGHTVRALTRKPDSPAARQIAAAGAELHAGDLGDAASIERAAKSADAMFLVTTFAESGMEAETEQGIAAAQAAKAAGVAHLVFSSVADANKATGIPHFDSKYRIEQALPGLGIPYTIIAPVGFMENATAPWAIGALQQGVQAFALRPDRKLQLVAVADIGAFAAAVIERGASVHGQRYDFAGDDISGLDQAAALSRAIGRPIQYQEIPLAAIGDIDTGLMFKWFDKVGYDVDIPALKRAFPEVAWHTYEDWARGYDWSVLGQWAEAATA